MSQPLNGLQPASKFYNDADRHRPCYGLRMLVSLCSLPNQC